MYNNHSNDDKYIYTFRYREDFTDNMSLERKAMYIMFNIIYILQHYHCNYYMNIYSIIDYLLKDYYDFNQYYCTDKHMEPLDFYKFKPFDNDIKMLSKIYNLISLFIPFISKLSNDILRKCGIKYINYFLKGDNLSSIEEFNKIYEPEKNFEIISFYEFKCRIIETNRLIRKKINTLKEN